MLSPPLDPVSHMTEMTSLLHTMARAGTSHHCHLCPCQNLAELVGQYLTPGDPHSFFNHTTANFGTTMQQITWELFSGSLGGGRRSVLHTTVFSTGWFARLFRRRAHRAYQWAPDVGWRERDPASPIDYQRGRVPRAEVAAAGPG